MLCEKVVLLSICVGIIGITGLTLAWLHIQSMAESFISDYDRILIVKLSLAMPVVIIGGYHQFWISKIMKKLDLRKENDIGTSWIHFNEKFVSLKKTVKIECLVAVSVLCVASFLTVTNPSTATQDNETIMQSTKDKISHIMYSKFIRTLETQGYLSGLLYSHSLLVLITLQSTYLTTMKLFTRFQMSQLSSKKAK